MLTLKNKAIFLDRDGTINVEKHYLYQVEEFEFLPGIIEGLKMLQDAGYILIVITNQSGIGRGYYTEEDFNKLNNWMLDTLELKGVHISKVYYCPHLSDAIIDKYRVKCDCRKPRLGLFYQAVKDFNIDLSLSYSIGDKLRDCAICKFSMCKGYLIGDNELLTQINDVKMGKVKNVNYLKSLIDVATQIISGNN